MGVAGRTTELVSDGSTVGLERLATVLLCPLVIGFGAHIAVPLPPDGVPMTLQSLFVVLAAIGLGPGLGTLGLLLYLAMGALGAQFFAGGNAGLAVLIGQTGGYLIGFVLCQSVVGPIVRRRDGSLRGWGALIAAVLSANAVIFAVGVPWLWAVRALDDPTYGLVRAIHGGLVPFLPGLALKAALAVVIGRMILPHATRRLW